MIFFCDASRVARDTKAPSGTETHFSGSHGDEAPALRPSPLSVIGTEMNTEAGVEFQCSPRLRLSKADWVIRFHPPTNPPHPSDLRSPRRPPVTERLPKQSSPLSSHPPQIFTIIGAVLTFLCHKYFGLAYHCPCWLRVPGEGFNAGDSMPLCWRRNKRTHVENIMTSAKSIKRKKEPLIQDKFSISASSQSFEKMPQKDKNKMRICWRCIKCINYGSFFFFFFPRVCQEQQAASHENTITQRGKSCGFTDENQTNRCPIYNLVQVDTWRAERRCDCLLIMSDKNVWHCWL